MKKIFKISITFMLYFGPSICIATQSQLIEQIKKLKTEWSLVKATFDATIMSGAEAEKTDNLAWPKYHSKLMGFLSQLSYTNYYTKSVEHNLKEVMKTLEDSFNVLQNHTSVQLKEKIKILNGLSSKYNLGKFARIGDEYYIKDFKALLADTIIPNIIEVYEKALKQKPIAISSTAETKTNVIPAPSIQSPANMSHIITSQKEPDTKSKTPQSSIPVPPPLPPVIATKEGILTKQEKKIKASSGINLIGQIKKRREAMGEEEEELEKTKIKEKPAAKLQVSQSGISVPSSQPQVDRISEQQYQKGLGREALLEQIRKGKELKKVSSAPRQAVAQEPNSELAQRIAKVQLPPDAPESEKANEW